MASTAREHGRTAAPPARTWTRVFPAQPEQIHHARAELALALEGCPVTDEAVLCLSELATNATLHSHSRHGGSFTVRAEIAADYLRVEVCDEGGPWAWHPPESEQHGRGLLIVSQLARSWGRTGTSESGWSVWFTLDCP